MKIFPAATILAQVVLIDISLAADNAIVIGMAANGLPPAQRHKAVWMGLAAAMVIRIGLALFATKLLHVAGLTAAGGFLLLWVTWKMFQEIRHAWRLHKENQNAPMDAAAIAAADLKKQPKKLSTAVLQILMADLGMSLDNILAVAGAARDHYYMLSLGLFLSIALMGFAATATARMLHRWPWLSWIGTAVIFGVALRMIWQGGGEVLAVVLTQ
jgi:YjbE family integral membrane protein